MTGRAFVFLMAVAMAGGCTSNFDVIKAAAQARSAQERAAPPVAQGAPPAVAVPPEKPFVAAPVTVAPEVVPEGKATVARGETLYALSRRLNVEVGDLVRANSLEPPFAVRAGQVLIVPAARYHRVRAGETLFAIARAYNVDMTLLARANALEPPYAARLGQRLKLPADLTLEERAARFTLAIPDAKTAPVVEPPPGATVAIEPPPKPAPADAQPAQPAAPVPAFAGRFRWPVDGKVISRFGPKPGGLFNDGVNIAAPMNAPVRANNPSITIIGAATSPMYTP